LKEQGYKPKACCCGHGKYPMTIVVQTMGTDTHVELFSDKMILRSKRFYKTDEEGYYYIPEVTQ
jgi:hypothetical protein